MTTEDKRTIDDEVNGYSLDCDAFIYKELPFEFLDQIAEIYLPMNKSLEPFKLELYNRALDVYSYYVRNGVQHDAKRMGLMVATRYAITECYTALQQHYKIQNDEYECR